MSWAKFDDRFPNHPKVLALSDAEFRLHVSAICYCCDQLTDGVLPECVPSSLPRAPRAGRLLNAIASLERIGLWDRIDGGWEVHDFLDWNPSADRVKEKKAARAAAGRAGGLAKAKQLASKTPSNCQVDRIGLPRTCSKQTSAPSPSPSPSPSLEEEGSPPTSPDPNEPIEMTSAWRPSQDRIDNLLIGGALPSSATEPAIVMFRNIHLGKTDARRSWEFSWASWATKHYRAHPERFKPAPVEDTPEAIAARKAALEERERRWMARAQAEGDAELRAWAAAHPDSNPADTTPPSKAEFQRRLSAIGGHDD